MYLSGSVPAGSFVKVQSTRGEKGTYLVTALLLTLEALQVQNALFRDADDLSRVFTFERLES